MRIKDVLTSLKDAYIDWGHFLINPRNIPREQKDENNRVLYQEITWDHRNPDYRITEPVSEAAVIQCVNMFQYSYQTQDGSDFKQPCLYRLRAARVLRNRWSARHTAQQNAHQPLVDFLGKKEFRGK